MLNALHPTSFSLSVQSLFQMLVYSGAVVHWYDERRLFRILRSAFSVGGLVSESVIWRQACKDVVCP